MVTVNFRMCNNVLIIEKGRWLRQDINNRKCTPGDEPDPGFLATGTKFGEQFSCLYVERYMSIA